MPTVALLLALVGGQNLLVNSMPSESPAKNFYSFKMNDIDGHNVALSKFKGKVLLVVNVASKCGYTPQYKGLEDLFESRKDKGFAILGFPANNFGSQEPGTNPDIKSFCMLNYGVKFPMFAKISVKGDDEAELYHWLRANSDRPTEDIGWNFEKFVIGKDGMVAARFKSATTPEDPKLLAAIDEALAK